LPEGESYLCTAVETDPGELLLFDLKALIGLRHVAITPSGPESKHILENTLLDHYKRLFQM